MKKFGIFLLITGILFAITRGTMHCYAIYEYENQIESNWDLADKASTIVQKSEYIDKFIIALEKTNLNGTNNAIFFDTPSNSFDENIKAVKSLQLRLKTISTMNENSFEYQTAMQQITAQEQGEAQNILCELSNCWMKVNHYSLWNCIIVISLFISQILIIGIGWLMIIDY